MCRVSLQGKGGKADIQFEVSNDWFTCLIPALLAGLPAFIDSFMKCIAGGGGSGEYKPGGPPRCG